MNFSETKQFVKTEKELNYLNGELLRYAVLLSGNQLNNSDLKYLNSSIRSVSDLERNHIQRLVNGECTPQVGAEYLSLAKNAERIADHLINVGNTIKQ